MTKTEMVAAVAEKTGLSKKDSANAVNAVFDTITDVIKNGDKITVVGFGTFASKERAAREGINPLTKKKIKIAAAKVPYFKASSALKDLVK